jgi:hypothetical protein
MNYHRYSQALINNGLPELSTLLAALYFGYLIMAEKQTVALLTSFLLYAK